MKNRRAFIIGIQSTSLNDKEKKFLKKYKPWGVILFSRNILSINQTKILTNEIRSIFKDKNYPIMIDEEGGRVSRLKKLINTDIFTGEFFGKLFKKDRKKFILYYKIFINQICFLLKNIGVNINTVPVLDIRYKNSDKIIGNRSFGFNHKNISKIGNFCIDGFHKNNIATVMKHIPGHGLAMVDSHKKTPVIFDKISKLNKKDFFTFKKKKSLFAMTGHVIYRNIDKIYTATHSQKVINFIRNKIKFNNLLISDDISMKSLKFSIKINTKMAFRAGCNIVLHCNANHREMIDVAKNSPKIDNFIIKKTSQFYKILS
tara:strand:+ start:2462 stop:3409 length:948 start_codon:yes stop_codon:yes gene_type:complete